MAFTVALLNEPGLKSDICADIIATLPDWFGIPESNRKYIADMCLRDVFAAYDGAKPVGLIALKYHFNETAEIWWVGLAPDYRRRGIGAQLFAAAKNHAQAKGCRRMIVNTLSPRSPDEHYARTRAFYEKMGFVPLFEEKTDDPHNPMMWMILDL